VKDLTKARCIDPVKAERIMQGADVTGDEIAWGVFQPSDAQPFPFVAQPYMTTDAEVTPLPVYLGAATLDDLHQMLPPGLEQIEPRFPREADLIEVWL